jgi:hypothetical protein
MNYISCTMHDIFAAGFVDMVYMDMLWARIGPTRRLMCDRGRFRVVWTGCKYGIQKARGGVVSLDKNGTFMYRGEKYTVRKGDGK